MLTKTEIQVPKHLIDQALAVLPSDEFRHTINKPTGNFFYDPWEIKDEYKDTVWANLLSYLPQSIGEARVILLDHSKCYQIHADIDDRYHLNLTGTNSFLVNLENNNMHQLIQDGYWYDMNAGVVHSAVNFGRTVRVQLVVRKLLKTNELKDPVNVTITTGMQNKNHARFLFDNSVSPWLNKANKLGFINNFSYFDSDVNFDIELNKLESLKTTLPSEFDLV